MKDMTVEAPPLHRGPVIRTPERKVRGVRKALAVTAAATGLAITGLLGYEAIQPKQTPEQTPIPGGIVEPSNSPIPTPFSTESPTITLPPTPEVSPSPTPTPEATPVPSIEQVKLEWPGRFNMYYSDKSPYYRFDIDKATVVAKELDEKTGTEWLAVTIAGNKIKKENCQKPTTVNNSSTLVQLCNYTGETIWIKTNKHTGVYSSDYSKLGVGVKYSDPYLKVGQGIYSAHIFFNYDYSFLGLDPMTSADKKMNINSLAKLKASVGKSFPRSDRRFSFYAIALTLDTTP